MGRSDIDLSTTVQSEMTKLCCLLLGVITIATIVTAWDEESSSLSQEMAGSRLARSPQKPARTGRKIKGKSIKKGRTSKRKPIFGGKKPKKVMKKKNKEKKGKAQRNVIKKKRGKGQGKEIKKKRGKVQRKEMKKNKGENIRSEEMSEPTVPGTCFQKAMAAMKVWKDTIGNFEKQSKRMMRQNETMVGKLGKKDDFESINQKLISAGGGNKSALSCSGSSTSPGAAQLANLTSVLGECQTDISTDCDPSNIPQPNMTKLEECSLLADAFKDAAMECLSMSVGANKTDTDTACACWTSDSLKMMMKAAKPCKFPNETKEITDGKNRCIETFGKCRKYQDDASTSIAACGTSVSALTLEVAALTDNAAAAKEAQKVLKDLANSARRKRRTAEALSNCTMVSEVATTLTLTIVDFPSSPDIIILSASIVASSNVTCTAEEAESLSAVADSFEEAVTQIAEAIVAVQTQLQTLTGSTASPLVIAAVTEPATDAPSGTTMMY